VPNKPQTSRLLESRFPESVFPAVQSKFGGRLSLLRTFSLTPQSLTNASSSGTTCPLNFALRPLQAECGFSDRASAGMPRPYWACFVGSTSTANLSQGRPTLKPSIRILGTASSAAAARSCGSDLSQCTELLILSSRCVGICLSLSLSTAQPTQLRFFHADG